MNGRSNSPPRPLDAHAGLAVSSLVNALSTGGADAWRVHTAGLALRAAGEDAIVLSVGDPDFDTPSKIVLAAVDALHAGDTHYTVAGGVGALADAIAALETGRLGRAVRGSQVAAAVGAQNALYSLFRCLLEPGDEAILLSPPYTMFPGVVAACGAQAVRVPLDVANDFALDVDAVARAMTPRTRAVLANFPHNPSGAVPTAEAMDALSTLCRERGVWLVSDEAYIDLCYDAPFISPAAGAGDTRHVAVVRSLSKSHAMTGWRMGWVVATESLAAHLCDFMNHVTYGAPGFIQRAAISAICEEHPELEHMRATYRERRDHLVAALKDVPGLRVVSPPAGIFCMVDVSGTGLNGEAFAEALIEAEKVSVLPGSAFDPLIANYVRISLCEPVDRLDEATRRMTRFIRARNAARV